MLGLIGDKLRTWRLRAKYERMVQERVVELVEANGPRPVSEDPGRWLALGESKLGLDDGRRIDARTRARRLATSNPHARNVLRLLEVYVVGPGLVLTHDAREDERDASLAKTADRLWSEFLRSVRPHYSLREHARRTWRDGESFVRLFPGAQWPPAVRFVDPETIGPPPGDPDGQGIVTDPDDVEIPLFYQRLDLATGRLAEEIPAAEMLHTRVGVDSNEKRGLTIFEPIAGELECFETWRETELLARKLQASIVLWRKVHGPPSRVAATADDAAADSIRVPYGGTRRERFRGGTILTTSPGTELEFLHPDTNFGDAVPLGRLLLLCVAAGAGLPEFMLTSDASNGNFASTMVAEGPAVKLFQSEQRYFADEFERLWRWVIGEAIRFGLLPADALDRLAPQWTFPQLVNRDRSRERLADVRLVDAGVLSRSEVARRDGVEPAAMRREIAEERAA